MWPASHDIYTLIDTHIEPRYPHNTRYDRTHSRFFVNTFTFLKYAKRKRKRRCLLLSQFSIHLFNDFYCRHYLDVLFVPWAFWLPKNVYVWQRFCKFFSFDMHILEVDTYCDLWGKKHTSIDTLEIEMTRIARQLEYYKLQLKYPENSSNNNRRTSYTHLHT